MVSDQIHDFDRLELLLSEVALVATANNIDPKVRVARIIEIAESLRP